MVDEVVDEGIPLTKPGFGDLEADTQRDIEESLKDAHGAHRGPLPPVVFREPDTGKYQPLPEVEGKGKEKVSVEQAAQVLLNLQTPKKKSPTKQYIFQRRTSEPTKPSGHDESSSLYAELGLTESDTKSDEEVPPVVKSGAPDEGQAGPNPVTDAVDWAMHAPLRERFRDLPEADMKEILHNQIYQLLSDLAKARKKKKKRQGSPKTPSGSLPHPLPPPPPPAGPFGTSGASGAFGSSQSPPSPLPPSNTQGGQSSSTAAPAP
ncbi:hypothetical protein Tco_1581462 [Tanacetum coccineum]